MGQSTNSVSAPDDPVAGAFVDGSSLTVPYVRLHNNGSPGEVWWVNQHPGRLWHAGAAGECFLCGWMTFDHPDCGGARKVIACHIRSRHGDLTPVKGAALLNRIVGAHDGDMACGSMAGYWRHRRAHQPACARCLKDWALYQRTREGLRHQAEADAALAVSPLRSCLGADGTDKSTARAARWLVSFAANARDSVADEAELQVRNSRSGATDDPGSG